MGKAATSKKATSEKILESAEKLFWFKGHKATSLDDIAREAGQSKGAFFHYFRNKGDITKQVLQKYAQEELFAPLDASFEAAPNAKEALFGWIMSVYQSYSESQYKGGCFLGNMALELSDQDEELRQDMSKIFLDWENQLVSLLRTRTHKGQILMEVRQFARFLIVSLQGIKMSIKVHKDRNRASREFQALAEFIERMIQDA